MEKDPYKYFRMEARELLEGLHQGVLELDQGGSPGDTVAPLLRQAHTLKGASRVVKQPAIAEHAHSLEDALAPSRDLGAAVPRETIGRVLGLLGLISKKVAALDALPAETGGETSRPSPDEFFESVRVEIDDVDSVLNCACEASVQLTALRRRVGALDRARQLAASL